MGQKCNGFVRYFYITLDAPVSLQTCPIEKPVNCLLVVLPYQGYGLNTLLRLEPQSDS